MLYHIQDVEWFTAQLIKRDAGLRYYRQAFEGRRDQHPPVRYYVDDPTNPSALVMWAGHQIMLVADPPAMHTVCCDIYNYRIGDQGEFPDSKLEELWLERGRRWLWLRTLGRSGYDAAVNNGFHITSQEYTRRGMWLYWLEGEPRFSGMVKHNCRVIHGMELYDLMRQGITYDVNGEYTKLCLENGPSFICEVDGEPVCWSCTHLSQQPGMIYTPSKYRRMGYARSLAAFQIDYMLKRDGYTHVFVVEHNHASCTMIESMGFERIPGLIVTYNIYWRRLRAPLISCSPLPTPGNQSWHGLLG